MDIPFDLLHIVASFHTKPKMKLYNWIPEYKLDWEYLSKNPNALHMLEANPTKIDWDGLSENPNAIHLLKANPKKINWRCLSQNPSIFEIDIKQTQIYLRKKAKDIDYYV